MPFESDLGQVQNMFSVDQVKVLSVRVGVQKSWNPVLGVGGPFVGPDDPHREWHSLAGLTVTITW